MKNYEELVRSAAKGDQQAFTQLYEMSYRDMYYVALKYMKNEEAAEDVLQEAYIRAWKYISTIKDPRTFPGWISKIVANQSKNALEKKNPLLFSEMENEDDDGNELAYDVADEKIENQPELNYTQSETQELVREMISGLSDEQRLCVIMFYLENMSISEIARTLGVSENTVKSRLNYGRKNLKAKADEMEKKGYKLLGVGVLPLLMWLLKSERLSSIFTASADKAMLAGENAVMTDISGKAAEAASFTGKAVASETSKTVSAGTASKAAGSAASAAVKTGAAHVISGKVVAIIAAAAVAVGAGAGVGVYAIASHSNNTNTETTYQEEASTAASAAGESSATERVTAETTEETTVQSTTEETTTEETTTEPETEAVITLTDEDYPNYISGNLTKEEFEYTLSAITNIASDALRDGFTEGVVSGVLNQLVQTQAGVGNSLSVKSMNEGHVGQYSVSEINRYFSAFSHYQFTSSGMLYTVDGDTLTLRSEASLSVDTFATIESAVIEDNVMTVVYEFNTARYGDGQDTAEQKTAVLTQLDDGMYRVTDIY